MKEQFYFGIQGGGAADDAVFTPAEAAAYLRISKRTLRMLRDSPHGPEFFMVKKSFRYTKAALDEYIKKQTAAMRDNNKGELYE